MDVSKLLRHLQDIHDAPDDGRDFVAFEKRPDMLAAGVAPEAFDRFDFSSRPAVQREIGLLGGGPIRPPEPPAPIERQVVESNPKGFVARGDIMAGVMSDYEQLPQAFIANNMRHFTRANGRDRVTVAGQDLVDVIADISRTESGRQMLAQARDKNLKQNFIYDPTLSSVARASREGIFYNPAAVEAYRKGSASGDVYVPGDEHETATLGAAIDHEFGHTEIGRRAFGLPKIPISESYTDQSGGIVITNGPPREEERRAVREFENRYRKSRGLPLRRSYFKENDIF